MMKNRPGEKIKLASLDELSGVVNEESAMEIEINKIHKTFVRRFDKNIRNAAFWGIKLQKRG